MRKIFFLIFTIVFTINLSAAKIENPTDSAVTNENVNTQEESKLVMLEPTPEVKAKIDNYLLEIGKINDLLEDDILLKRYSNYIAYRSISKELHSLKDELTDVNKKK